MGLFSKKPSYCSICNKELIHKHKPKREWNIKGPLCGDCHFDKSKEYYEGKVRQPCVECGLPKKLQICGNQDGSGTWKACCVRNVLIKKKRVLEKRRIFVPYAEVKWD